MSKISKQIDLILNNDTVTVKDKLFLYRNDFGLQFKFNIKENKYLFDNNTYISEFENCKAAVTFVKPSGEAFYINTAIVENGLLVFEFTKDMVDEVQELGFYKIQFHLFNKDRSARVTIPAFEIEVRDLIGIESTKDNQPIVDIAEVGRAKLVATQDNYRISLFSIDEEKMKVVNISNNDITVIRGFDGTDRNSHGQNSVITCVGIVDIAPRTHKFFIKNDPPAGLPTQKKADIRIVLIADEEPL